MIEEREAFLRAIFDAPDDDTPRLVYADWLQEHDYADHAELIRLQCELARRKPGEQPTAAQYARQSQLIKAVTALDQPDVTCGFPNRGFRYVDSIRLSATDLGNPQSLRETAALRRPEWFAATCFRLNGGKLTSQLQIQTLLELPCFGKIKELDLSGNVQLVHTPNLTALEIIQSAEYNYESVISMPALDLLVRHRGMKRIRVLRLTNNELDNDAMQLLIRSNNLDNLKLLEIRQGNNLRGRVWAQVVQRFGEDVVS